MKKDDQQQVYLDNNATTRTASEVVEAMLPYLSEYYGNASSIHAAGLRADEAVASARRKLAGLLGVSTDKLFFTSGGTEGNNTLIKGLARARRKQGRHIITTAMEHASVEGPMRRLEQEGFEVTRIEPRHGIIEADMVLEHMREDTVLVSVMHVNNETGAVMPIRDVANRIKAERRDIIVHSDGVQAFGKLHLSNLSVDAYTISGHKIHAPKGIGAAYLRYPQYLKPLMEGGGQENNLRSGTQNVPGIVALAEAAGLVYGELERDMEQLKKLNYQFREGLAHYDDTYINTPDKAVSNTLNVSFVPVPGEVMVNALSDAGIYVSSGSACNAGSGARSRVLKAMNLSDARVESSVRFSMSRYTTDDEIERTLSAIREILPRLQRMANLQRA